MTRLPRSSESDVRKGAWGADEDEKLREYVETYGTGHWRSVGKRAGLQRCGKSCRLRWTNYLRPDIRHGSFTTEEEDLIIKLHAAHGSRWSLIATQLPGRTDNDIKNHWNTRLKKKLCDMGIDPVTHQPIAELLRTLAGTMASGSTGNQLAEEAARRCFRDNMLNKAVREYGIIRPPTGPSKDFFSAETPRSSVDQRTGNPATAVVQFHSHDDGVAAAREFIGGANAASSEAYSVDGYSSSSTEPVSQMLSDHSSPPLQYRGLTHMSSIRNVHPRGTTSYRSVNLQEFGSAAGHSQDVDEVVYLPCFSGQDLAPTTQGTLQNLPPDSHPAFRRSADCDGAALGGTSSGAFQAREAQLPLLGAPGPADPHPHPQPAHPQARWYDTTPSRPDHHHHHNNNNINNINNINNNINNNNNNYIVLSHDRTKFESEIPIGFSPTVSTGVMPHVEPSQLSQISLHAGHPLPAQAMAATGDNDIQFESLRFRSLDGAVPLLPEHAVIPRVSLWD